MKRLLTFVFLLCSILKPYAQTLNFEATRSNYDTLEWADKALTADFNGDGQLDFIVSWETQRKLYVGLNNGLAKPIFIPIDEGSQLVGLTIVDLDMDGDLDFVGAAPFENASFWWENDGTATFTKQTLTTIEDYDGIHFADLDGDNQLEAIISIEDGLHIYANDAGVFTRQATLFEDFFGDKSLAIQTFDNNNDGAVDIAATFNRNGIIVYQQTPNSGFERIDVAEDLFNQTALFATDINQDGGIDFVSSSTFNGTSSIVTNNNDGTYTVTNLPKDEFGRIEFTTVGDVDNDGDDDILYYERVNSLNFSLSLLVNNNGEFTKQLLSDEYARIETASIIDLNGDGSKEIVVFSNAEGFVVFRNTADMSTSTFEEINQPLTIFPNLITSFFKIESKGKFDYVVSSVSGKEITKGTAMEQIIIDCNNWNKGTYFITVNQKGHLNSSQLIKIN